MRAPRPAASRHAATGAVALVLAMTLAGGARAAVVSAMPGTTLGTIPDIITIGTATFSFTAADPGFGANSGAAVSTGGTGQVTTFLGGVTDFGAGSTIDQTNELYTFAAYPTAAVIPNSVADDFIGLLYTAPDGIHYGYAEVDGPQLVSYGYQTTAGTTILTGAQAVPEPASLAILAVGGLGLAAVRRRRRRSPAAA